MRDFDAVKKIGLALPDVVEGTAYGAPALKLRGKILACVPSNKSAEANSIMVRVDAEHRSRLMRKSPGTYYLTDHYAPHSAVLVRLPRIGAADLKRLLQYACEELNGAAPHPPRAPRAAARRSRARRASCPAPRS
jgi:hypothetical protein